MERYDAAVIGAGPEGLVAATALARARRRVIVLERQARAGGRAETTEFHPGFKASTYAEELAFIPPRLIRALDLPRHGAMLIPAPASLCVSDEGASILFSDAERRLRSAPSQARAGLASLDRERAALKLALDARALADSNGRWRERFPLFGLRRSIPWPGSEWALSSLDDLLQTRIPDPLLRLHLTAQAVSGRAVSPYLPGTALNLLAPGAGESGMVAGGLGRLGAALERIAIASGVVFRFGAEVKALRTQQRRVAAAVLGGGEEVQARAVLSTLDIKQSLLGLVPPSDLADDIAAQASSFVMRGARARVLFALEALPDFALREADPDIRLGPIHVVPSLGAISRTHDSWHAGVLPAAPLVTLRFPSLSDPSLAPLGKATMTATISAVPGQLRDGLWTVSKRERLARLALEAAERVAPGVSERMLSWRGIVPGDIEASLGLIGGDLDGGDISPAQALGYRPFPGAEWRDGRTPLKGLYLAGPSAAPAPSLFGVSGERAARSLLADVSAEERK